MLDKTINNKLVEYQSDEEKLQRKLKAAMDYARNICILGANNKIKDIRKSNAWCLNPSYRYHSSGRYLKLADGQFSDDDKMPNAKRNPVTGELIFKINQWYYHSDNINTINQPELTLETIHDDLHPLLDPRFKLHPLNQAFLERTLLTIAKRAGNCGARSELVAKYLWEHPEGIKRIEAISTSTFDHEFIIVNRSGNLKEPETWGDAWIIDAWYGRKGRIFHARDFVTDIKKIKKFALNQVKSCERINLIAQSYMDADNDIDKCLWEVLPERDCYPSYAPNLHLEDYYIVCNSYPGLPNPNDSSFLFLQKDVEAHQMHFRSCLDAIEMHSSQQGQSEEKYKENHVKNSSDCHQPVFNKNIRKSFKGSDIMSQAQKGLSSVIYDLVGIGLFSKKSKVALNSTNEPKSVSDLEALTGYTRENL